VERIGDNVVARTNANFAHRVIVAGHLDTVILSVEHYHALTANQDKRSRAARRKEFEAEFGEWISAQNDRFEAHGIPGADLRPW
ncbi:MAG: hypothetical protein EBT04_12615, partial [Betaproteobacteria bacterium]|nr:hypothetical protein [Betaproteobacteria bacterium]